MDPRAVFSELRRYSLDFQGAEEDHPWGDTVWKVGGKIFVFAGTESGKFTVKATLDQQAVLILHPNIERAAYVGRFGWVTVHVQDEESLGLCREMIEASYRMIAPKRFLQEA